MNIKQLNKAELIAYAAEVGREDLNESLTKKEIIYALEEDGLDKVKPPEREKKEILAEDNDQKIVKMIRKASYYSYGPYVFTENNKFVLMDSESADQIIRVNPDSFKIATTKEVEDFYK